MSSPGKYEVWVYDVKDSGPVLTVKSGRKAGERAKLDTAMRLASAEAKSDIVHGVQRVVAVKHPDGTIEGPYYRPVKPYIRFAGFYVGKLTLYNGEWKVTL